MNKLWNHKIQIVSLVFLLACDSDKKISSYNIYADNKLHKLEYNNPDILVDLDVGFKSVPMPMDFDGDGDIDLLVSESGSYAESGVFYFENISGNSDSPIFRYGMRINSERFRLGDDGSYFVVSEVERHTHVLTPDRVNQNLLKYEDVPQNVFWKQTKIDLSSVGGIQKGKASTWKILDFDGDGLNDLMCGYNPKPERYLLFYKNTGNNEQPNYTNPKKVLTDSGELLGNNLFHGVTISDFDNDGDFDYLLVGLYCDFVYYENRGTPTNYKFVEGKPLLFEGKKIQLVSKYGSASKPRPVDFNKDGFVDIIAGDEDGKVSFLKNTGTIVDGVPQFLPPVFFQQEAKFVDFGALTAPRIFDWDNDGKDDIVSANAVGNIGFIRNISDDELRFDGPKLLKADEKEILVLPEGANWGYLTIDVGYWNEDDLPDILGNDHNGNVIWFENIGTKKEPKLSAAKPIKVQWNGEPQKPAYSHGTSKGNELLAQWRTSPYIMDFNNDGLNDLVMLDYEGYLVVYPRFKKGEELLLAHPEKNFVFPTGEPILLNQLKGSSSGRLKITFNDWDGDGLEDLIVSSKPAVDWMKNLGIKDGKMVLQYMGRVLSRTLMGHTDGPVTPDFNKDGIPDLLVGTETGVFYYWQRPSFEITTTMTTTGKQTPANYKYFKR